MDCHVYVLHVLPAWFLFLTAPLSGEVCILLCSCNVVRLELWSHATSLKTGTHHNHLWGFQDDALTSTPQAACWSFAKTGKKKRKIILTKCWVKIKPLIIKKKMFVAFLSSDFLTPKRMNKSLPPQITQIWNRQHEMFNRVALSRQFLLSAEATSHRRERPASGKVYFHDITTCTVFLTSDDGGRREH